MSKFNTIILLIGFIFISYVLFNVLTKKEITSNNNGIIKGKFSSIKQDKKNTQLYYNSFTLKLEDYSKTLRILPEYKNCFNYEEFISEVKSNDEIEVRIDESDNRLSNHVESVISIRAKSKNYINLNCVNKSIQKQKVQLPIILLGLVIFLFLIIFIQKKLGININ
ncbi:hypothetical protein [Chryseobacterium aquaticum]|uniref:hypothetical protein n=1 Tax=Chryseobacterium aquaticum TaxID=452084 RepID=UPI002FC5E34F